MVDVPPVTSPTTTRTRCKRSAGCPSSATGGCRRSATLVVPGPRLARVRRRADRDWDRRRGFGGVDAGKSAKTIPDALDALVLIVPVRVAVSVGFDCSSASCRVGSLRETPTKTYPCLGPAVWGATTVALYGRVMPVSVNVPSVAVVVFWPWQCTSIPLMGRRYASTTVPCTVAPPSEATASPGPVPSTPGASMDASVAVPSPPVEPSGAIASPSPPAVVNALPHAKGAPASDAHAASARSLPIVLPGLMIVIVQQPRIRSAFDKRRERGQRTVSLPPPGGVLTPEPSPMPRRHGPRAPGTNEPILARLRSVEGHLRAVLPMVEQDAYCIDVLRQTKAIHAALSKVESMLLDRHLHHCVAKAVRSEEPRERERVLAELLDVFDARKGRDR